MSKLAFFIIVTILLISAVYMNGISGRWKDNAYLTLMYIGFILVALYELGKEE